ncbi:3-isopropylmalate dehydratase large subunit [Candidatus Bathyarchaeota archaeon]|nr:3-isopropylmalate dehydratase large subunit [Candidatus Bathyarchaeota archaeon]
MGYTISEKILSHAAGLQDAKAGEIVKAKVDLVMINDATGVLATQALKDLGKSKVWDPEKVVIVNDHFAPACTIQAAKVHKELRAFAKDQNIRHLYDVGEGVCHQLIPEKGHVKPGIVIVGADSHTCTYGAFGCFATGVGSTDAGVALAFGKNWFKIPESIKIEITGKLKEKVTPKDIILMIAQKIGVSGATYMSLEFTGETIRDMSVSGRMTLCNMAIEMGAKSGLVEPDDKTYAWLKSKTSGVYQPVMADEDAKYKKILKLQVDDLEPQIACPHNVDNVKPVSNLKDVKVNQIFVGSCTNGRLEDLEQVNSVIKGHKIHKEVRMIVVPASKTIFKEALRKGIISDLSDAGAIISNPSCATCFGGSIGILAPGEVGLTTSNRNFRGRQGSLDSEVYLCSPYVAAVSALTGKISDPREI